jgi:MATE family multidrug resistance protein
MLGLSMSTTSLVGQNMGARNVFEATRATFSGMKLALIYSLTITFIFIFIPHPLVNVLTSNKSDIDYASIVPISISMLRIAAIYLTSDALALIIGGALRGAGDTRWVMWASITTHWIFTSFEIYIIRWLAIDPLYAWIIYTLQPIAICLILSWRFKQGKWKSIHIVDHSFS